MSQLLKPCCNNRKLEVVDAPRTDGANAPEDVIRCASCGSRQMSRELPTERNLHLTGFFQSLAGRIVQSA